MVYLIVQRFLTPAIFHILVEHKYHCARSHGWFGWLETFLHLFLRVLRAPPRSRLIHPHLLHTETWDSKTAPTAHPATALKHTKRQGHQEQPWEGEESMGGGRGKYSGLQASRVAIRAAEASGRSHALPSERPQNSVSFLSWAAARNRSSRPGNNATTR